MSRFKFVILVLSASIITSSGLHPDKCKVFPKEKHCLIEYSVRDRWPHQLRYVYNWYTKACFEVRWSDNCPPVLEPTTSNNFPTEKECLDQCGGWA